MRRCKSSWAALSAAALVALWLGCKGETGTPGSYGESENENGGSVEPRDGPGGGSEGGGSDTAGTPVPGGHGGESTAGQIPSGEPGAENDHSPAEGAAAGVGMPEVRLPEMLEKTCLVRVGDVVPDVPLDVLGGEQQGLRSQLGRRLTVMFFWESDNLYAQDELRDLTGDVAEPFDDEGVKVIGINVGDPAEKAAEAVEAADAAFPNFLDPDGEYFAKIATGKLPRTYLLDADGRVLWFDLEYSLTTRRQLEQAVEAALRDAPAAKPPGADPLVAARPEEPSPEAEQPKDPGAEPETPDEQPPETEAPEDRPAQPPEAPSPAAETPNDLAPTESAPEGGEDQEEEADPQSAPAPTGG